MHNPLHLASLTGQYGEWRYYQAIMPVRELVNIGSATDSGTLDYRVKTVDEVREIYSTNLSDMLQRVFDPRRLKPMTDYLLKRADRYVNNLTVAIYGGDPQWLPMDVTALQKMPDVDTPPEAIQALGNAFGVIRLNGSEILFVLDGQHRLKGLRAAVAKNSKLGDDEIALTLVTHRPTPDGKKRTRRLFTTVNRYAKPVSLGESILLDEDDVSAIVVRRLVEGYKPFCGKGMIALNKTADLKLPKDRVSFSTVLALWSINECLIDNDAIYPRYDGGKSNLIRVRPESEAVVDQQEELVRKFWDLFFKVFPAARSFVAKPNPDARNKGGPFSLRPIGQRLFADAYMALKAHPKEILRRFKSVPDDLSNKFWSNVLFNPSDGTMMRKYGYARDYLFQKLGIPLSKKRLARLKENLKKQGI
jgi:DNA sulfur modification protein DndB